LSIRKEKKCKKGNKKKTDFKKRLENVLKGSGVKK